MLTLDITERSTSQKPVALRATGILPAVFYGRKEDTASVAVDQLAFEKVWREAGENTVITLAGVGEPKEALIHDVALDPLTDAPIHVDFYVIEKGKKLTVAVPLTFEGVAPAVRDKGGILVKVLHELEIEALPKDLPHDISIDLSVLTGLDSHISVGDLKLPDGVVATNEPTDTVVSIAAQQEEEEEAPTDIDMSAIEVEGEKKTDEESESDAEGEKEEKK